MNIVAVVVLSLLIVRTDTIGSGRLSDPDNSRTIDILTGCPNYSNLYV